MVVFSHFHVNGLHKNRFCVNNVCQQIPYFFHDKLSEQYSNCEYIYFFHIVLYKLLVNTMTQSFVIHYYRTNCNNTEDLLGEFLNFIKFTNCARTLLLDILFYQIKNNKV